MTLREWIADQQLTQREAAARLGVHEITLNRWLSGKAIPQRRQLEAIRQISGVEPATFFPSQAA
jgi:transcriptional regulator with XRE-family HTH domain